MFGSYVRAIYSQRNGAHDSGAPEVEITDSFFVGDHPSQGPYDQMIYWLDAEMGGGTSSGSLTLRDHNSASALTRQWGSGAKESGNLGTILIPVEITL